MRVALLLLLVLPSSTRQPARIHRGVGGRLQGAGSHGDAMRDSKPKSMDELSWWPVHRDRSRTKRRARLTTAQDERRWTMPSRLSMARVLRIGHRIGARLPLEILLRNFYRIARASAMTMEIRDHTSRDSGHARLAPWFKPGPSAKLRW